MLIQHSPLASAAIVRWNFMILVLLVLLSYLKIREIVYNSCINIIYSAQLSMRISFGGFLLTESSPPVVVFEVAMKGGSL